MGYSSDQKIGAVGIVATVGFIGALVLAQGECSPGPGKAQDALRTMGFRDVKIIGSHPYAPSFYGCDKNDAVAHEATATNAQGQRVSVVVCCGMVMKGCTVRTP